MDKSDVSRQIEELAEQFKADSTYSIDYGRNAKAIAFASPEVRDKVAEIISQGYVITSVRPIAGFGSSLTGFKLGVEFESSGAPAVTKQYKALIVTVEIPTQKVTRVVEANSLISDLPVATPFATVNPDPNADVRTPLSELQARRDAEASYFQTLGIPSGGPVRPGVKDPPFGSFTPPLGGGPIIINPGGPFGGGHGGVSSSTTITAPETTIPTQTGCETESEGIADDSANDDTDYDGSQPDNPYDTPPDHSAAFRFF